MTAKEIEARLIAEKDEAYGDFQARLMPTVARERILGVRTPILRRLAKELSKDPAIGAFLDELPHAYYDEYNLHGLIVAEGKDYDETVVRMDALLPYVDNWATCDIISPKCFKKNRERLKADIERWLESGETYTIRFGIEMVQTHYLEEDFDSAWLERIAAIRSGEYYVNMMLAWFFATALTKQWDAAMPVVEQRKLAPWVHNKTIQKAVESYRITDEQKTCLRSLKIIKHS